MPIGNVAAPTTFIWKRVWRILIVWPMTISKICYQQMWTMTEFGMTFSTYVLYVRSTYSPSLLFSLYFSFTLANICGRGEMYNFTVMIIIIVCHYDNCTPYIMLTNINTKKTTVCRLDSNIASVHTHTHIGGT